MNPPDGPDVGIIKVAPYKDHITLWRVAMAIVTVNSVVPTLAIRKTQRSAAGGLASNRYFIFGENKYQNFGIATWRHQRKNARCQNNDDGVIGDKYSNKKNKRQYHAYSIVTWTFAVKYRTEYGPAKDRLDVTDAKVVNQYPIRRSPWCQHWRKNNGRRHDDHISKMRLWSGVSVDCFFILYKKSKLQFYCS